MADKKKDAKKVSRPVKDMKGNDILENKIQEEANCDEKQEEIPKVELLLADVNNFINIVGIIMVGDNRSEPILKHFTKILVNNNPHLQFESTKQ